VDTDPFRAVINRHGTGELLHTPLGRAVSGVATLGVETVDRGYVEDRTATTLTSEAQNRVLGAEEYALQIDSEDVVPLLLAQLGHGLWKQHRGVVDQHVEPAEDSHCLIDNTLGIGTTRHVSDDKVSVTAGCGHQAECRGAPGLVTVDQHD